ncbi:MAG: hypothetical protein BWY27_01379 [Bacteroidetes bacterium ADurb.Bin234]|nr:MAG: hypothetical protein BWY27_01379 [Bacteroidetes bacterium ADurb.Bin234]
MATSSEKRINIFYFYKIIIPFKQNLTYQLLQNEFYTRNIYFVFPCLSTK